MLKALLFDLDGTLAETDSIHFLIWQECLCDYGLEIDRSFYKSKISGRLNPDIVADLLPQLNQTEQEDFIWRKEAEFRNRADSLTRLPGLSNLLDWATEKGLKQAVVSNAPRENAEFMLKALHLETRFDAVVLGDDLPVGKPDPLPYQEALKRFNLEKEEAIAFEDSPSGIQSAVAAGIRTVGIASTHAPDELRQLGATLVISDFTAPDLVTFLGRVIP
ncbi:MAG: HAD family phosphatase [Cyanobacteria bacterium RM1_2_2]|nr:HAD family phosphatase [Cyanobacteria bacterium RM1_2_2]